MWGNQPGPDIPMHRSPKVGGLVVVIGPETNKRLLLRPRPKGLGFSECRRKDRKRTEANLDSLAVDVLVSIAPREQLDCPSTSDVLCGYYCSPFCVRSHGAPACLKGGRSMSRPSFVNPSTCGRLNSHDESRGTTRFDCTRLDSGANHHCDCGRAQSKPAHPIDP